MIDWNPTTATKLALTFKTITFECGLVGDKNRRLAPIGDHFNIPIFARNVTTPVGAVVEITAVVFNFWHRVPADHEVRGRSATTLNVVWILVRHVRWRRTHWRMVGRQWWTDFVSCNHAERVVGPRTHFYFETRLGSRDVLERHFPAVWREARIELDGISQNRGTIVAWRCPFYHRVSIVALNAQHARTIRNI